ncbi:cathepsin L [Fistulifera solaris]|uniref:Cathepsin L n=1 Tax=Fistulifera solaris TaxID=1519565 RepID=A0A1Z5KK93_FISSO|nr:cathepsin L [Fistulifera solaris]|eukprot:GAX26451.1 cathepsin L [Fistulifera solaris]
MRYTSAILLLISAVCKASEVKPVSLEGLNKFEKWVEAHAKQYASDLQKMARLHIWLANDQRIDEHNNQKPAPTFTLGHNEYSDMTLNEFQEYFKLGPHAQIHPSLPQIEEEDSLVAEQRRALLEMDPLQLPDYVNWVELGAVTPVKNQGACGSCWAFSTTGALEGAKFVQTGELVALSEQNLLDCDHEDLGCSGGLMDNAFKFDQKSGGLCSEEDYPYAAEQHSTCFTNCTEVPGTIVKTFIDVPQGSEMALVSALSLQPVSIAIQASQFVFQFYKEGVITDNSCGSSGAIDHGVLAVGYGTDVETQEPYFLVKNSWGPSWGSEGFVKIGRKTTNQYGICSILKLASFPIVE